MAELAFQQIASFAEFGFCKAHAAALAETTYRSAWLKLYYPGEYYCALLNCQPMGFYSPEVIVNQARHEGIRVLPVDINLSRGRCTMEGGRIRLGFRYVKAVGEKAWQRSKRSEGGLPDATPTAGSSAAVRRMPLQSSLEDFYTRTRLDREAVENLIMVGAFDFLGVPRRQLLWQLGTLVKQPPNAMPAPVAGTRGEAAPDDAPGQGGRGLPDPGTLGRPPSHGGVPLRGLQERDQEPDIAAIPSGARVRVAGCVVCRQAPGTAKGHVFLTLEDETGLINVILQAPGL